MSAIDNDLDFIISKTGQLFQIVADEQFQQIETKELIRQQLINQFYQNYSPDEIATVAEKFELLVTRSAELTLLCEDVLQKTKQDMVKLKKSETIKKAYK